MWRRAGAFGRGEPQRGQDDQVEPVERPPNFGPDLQPSHWMRRIVTLARGASSEFCVESLTLARNYTGACCSDSPQHEQPSVQAAALAFICSPSTGTIWGVGCPLPPAE